MIEFEGLAIEENASLAPLTSWIVGGRADFLAQPKTVEELRSALRWAASRKLPHTIIGGGTNVLVSDAGVRGLTIALRKMSKCEVSEANGEIKLNCLAGTSKSELLKIFLKNRLEPALFLAGIPGDVGGGFVMNAGVGEKFVPREFVEITEWVEVMRLPGLEIERIEASQLTWAYRHCDGWQPGIVTSVGLRWPLQAPAGAALASVAASGTATSAPSDILTRVKDANRSRLSKQPLDMPSCGSVFRNPPGASSGQLIESCGLKGFAVGGAKVSEKHANFIVNFNEAKAIDIHQVIEHVKATVLSQNQIHLRTEVVYIGVWPELASKS